MPKREAKQSRWRRREVVGINGKQHSNCAFMLIVSYTPSLFLCSKAYQALVMSDTDERWKDILKAFVWSLIIMLMLIEITLNNRPVKSISEKKYTHYLITNLNSLHLTLSLHISRPLTKLRHKKTLLQSLKS
jgi:hypothetical protein